MPLSCRNLDLWRWRHWLSNYRAKSANLPLAENAFKVLSSDLSSQISHNVVSIIVDQGHISHTPLWTSPLRPTTNGDEFITYRTLVDSYNSLSRETSVIRSKSRRVESLFSSLNSLRISQDYQGFEVDLKWWNRSFCLSNGVTLLGPKRLCIYLRTDASR